MEQTTSIPSGERDERAPSNINIPIWVLRRIADDWDRDGIDIDVTGDDFTRVAELGGIDFMISDRCAELVTLGVPRLEIGRAFYSVIRDCDWTHAWAAHPLLRQLFDERGRDWLDAVRFYVDSFEDPNASREAVVDLKLDICTRLYEALGRLHAARTDVIEKRLAEIADDQKAAEAAKRGKRRGR